MRVYHFQKKMKEGNIQKYSNQKKIDLKQFIIEISIRKSRLSSFKLN